MTVEANLWNKNNSAWREIVDSQSIGINVNTNHQASFDLLPGGVSEAALANNAVTNAKLANMDQFRIKARQSSGSGDPEDLTLSEVLDFIGSAAHGDILYRAASGWARLGAGTANQRLLTKGASANLAWGGAPILLASGSLPAAATFDITDIPQVYTALVWHIAGISHNSGANQGPVVRFSVDNGASFDATSYRNSTIITAGGTTATASSGTSAVNEIATQAAGTSWNITIYIFGYSGGIYPAYLTGLDRIGTAHYVSNGHFIVTTAINALRVTHTGGNIDAGTHALYGIL